MSLKQGPDGLYRFTNSAGSTVTGTPQFLLTPDLTRSTAADAGTALWRQDAPNHFLFRSSVVGAAQGFGSSKTR